MNLKKLETKCPVCGSKNVPVEFTAEIGRFGPTVKRNTCVPDLCGGFLSRRRLAK